MMTTVCGPRLQVIIRTFGPRDVRRNGGIDECPLRE